MIYFYLHIAIHSTIESCTFLTTWASIISSIGEQQWASASAVLCISSQPGGSERSPTLLRLFGTCRAGATPMDGAGYGWSVSSCENPLLCWQQQFASQRMAPWILWGLAQAKAEKSSYSLKILRKTISQMKISSKHRWHSRTCE